MLISSGNSWKAPNGAILVSPLMMTADFAGVRLGGLEEKSTKTDRSRKPALDPFGIALLAAHRTRIAGWAQQTGGELP